MISSSSDNVTSPPMRLDAYTIPLGLYVDKSEAFHYGGGGANDEDEMDVMVQMVGGGGVSYHRHIGDDDWLPSERFDRLVSMASIGKRSKKNVTKKQRRSPSSSLPSSSWKFW